MYQNVIFDLDGTLLNTIDDLADAGNWVCAQRGWPEHTVEEYKRMVGNGSPKLVERFAPEQARDQATLKEALAQFSARYDAHKEDKTAAYPGMVDLIARLMGAGEQPKAPGMKYRHYAPKAPVTVVAGDPKKAAEYIAAHAGPADGIICFDEFKDLFTRECETRPVMDLGPAGDKGEQARHIFDALRAFDHTAVTAIWAQCPDTDGIGLAIANRLNKAAGFHIIRV